jgi:hypothetical protein
MRSFYTGLRGKEPLVPNPHIAASPKIFGDLSWHLDGVLSVTAMVTPVTYDPLLN